MPHSSRLGSKPQKWEALETARVPLLPSLQAELPASQGEGCPPLFPWSKESKFSSPSPKRSESQRHVTAALQAGKPPLTWPWRSGPGNPVPGSFALP